MPWMQSTASDDIQMNRSKIWNPFSKSSRRMQWSLEFPRQKCFPYPIIPTLSIWIILLSCSSRTQRLIVIINNQLLSGTNNSLKLSHERRSFTGQGNKNRFQPRLTFDCQKLAASFRAVPIGKPCSRSTQGYSVSNTNHTCGNKRMDIGTQNVYFLFGSKIG